jgi:nucleoside-diphosphate-sugar epimerase
MWAVRVAVTGASGFVGRQVSAELSQAGHDVIALVRDINAAPADTSPVVGSIEDDAALGRLVLGADAVVHAAGLVRSSDPAALQAINVDGSRRVAAAALEVPRFVLVSTAGVYGSCKRADEATRPTPPNAYERSKLAAELAVTSARARHVVIVRPTIVIGPDDPRRPLSTLLRTLGTRRLPIASDGWTNFVACSDVARVIRQLTEHDAPPRILNVCQPMSTDSFIELCATQLGTRSRLVSLPGPIAAAARAVVQPLGHRHERWHRLSSLLEDVRVESHVIGCAGVHPPSGLRGTVDQMIQQYRAQGVIP